MLGLACVTVEVFTDNVWKFLQTMFASANFRFGPSGSFFPCADVLSSCGDFFGSHAHRGFPFFSLPSFRRGGGRLGMPLCCFPRVLSSRSTFGEREGWRSRRSLVRCTQAHFCLLGSFVDWGFRSCSLAADSCYPHLCMPCEVMGRESLRGLFSVLCCLSHLISARSARW